MSIICVIIAFHQHLVRMASLIQSELVVCDITNNTNGREAIL